MNISNSFRVKLSPSILVLLELVLVDELFLSVDGLEVGFQDDVDENVEENHAD